MISDRARTLEEEKETRRVGAARQEEKNHKKKERERKGGRAAGERQERAGGIEERNQRRLSAYEVGIVGVRSLSKNCSPLGPVVASGTWLLDLPRQMFFLNGDELADK